MKLHISRDWVRKKLESDPDGFEEPGGLLACSPEIYAEMVEANRRALAEEIDRQGAEVHQGSNEERE